MFQPADGQTRQMNPTHDTGLAAIQASPAVTTAGLVLGGVSLQDWVLIAALVYTVMQTAYLIWKWRREAKRRDALTND